MPCPTCATARRQGWAECLEGGFLEDLERAFRATDKDLAILHWSWALGWYLAPHRYVEEAGSFARVYSQCVDEPGLPFALRTFFDAWARCITSPRRGARRTGRDACK